MISSFYVPTLSTLLPALWITAIVLTLISIVISHLVIHFAKKRFSIRDKKQDSRQARTIVRNRRALFVAIPLIITVSFGLLIEIEAFSSDNTYILLIFFLMMWLPLEAWHIIISQKGAKRVIGIIIYIIVLTAYPAYRFTPYILGILVPPSKMLCPPVKHVPTLKDTLEGYSRYPVRPWCMPEMVYGKDWDYVNPYSQRPLVVLNVAVKSDVLVLGFTRVYVDEYEMVVWIRHYLADFGPWYGPFQLSELPPDTVKEDGLLRLEE